MLSQLSSLESVANVSKRTCGVSKTQKVFTLASRSSHPTASVAQRATNIRGVLDAGSVLALFAGDESVPEWDVATAAS